MIDDLSHQSQTWVIFSTWGLCPSFPSDFSCWNTFDIISPFLETKSVGVIFQISVQNKASDLDPTVETWTVDHHWHWSWETPAPGTLTSLHPHHCSLTSSPRSCPGSSSRREAPGAREGREDLLHQPDQEKHKNDVHGNYVFILLHFKILIFAVKRIKLPLPSKKWNMIMNIYPSRNVSWLLDNIVARSRVGSDDANTQY